MVNKTFIFQIIYFYMPDLYSYTTFQAINECTSSPCRNGTCTDLYNGYTCTCAANFTGSNCNTCIPGVTGVNCDTAINLCVPNLCLNGANCTQVSVSAYNCSCVVGYTGANCQFLTNNCAVSPCLNGGKCVNGVGTFTCNCANTGYNGTTCQTDIDECTQTGSNGLVLAQCVNGMSFIFEDALIVLSVYYLYK